ncbi:hypothetical protein G7068_07200 [Leucobacter viscericola]|uniref:Membrane protein involved in the export of O-antigen and teichoic acid n=1 Tax=Leucobacter viscericola TaxID=2714935 RepID=A0A6G7XEI5_9MICO|nr:hypothetical protein [Leucobacter viscericola]QIK63004.1 hypothetical protein G7068_07200 [Leucobacter viscericola]
MTNTATNARSGLALVLTGTVVSAASSFIVLLIVAPALGAAGYKQFSVYWSALFMVVAILFGVQQESTRGVAAARGIAAPEKTATAQHKTSVLRFALLIAVALLVLVGATSPLWSEALFGTGTATWGVPLAIAVAAYAIVAATNGILAGTSQWAAFALLAVIDGVLRLVLVGLALGLHLGGTALAWAVAIPFPVSLAVVFFIKARTIRANTLVAGTAGSLAANMSRTLAASVAAAILINGFPVFMSLFGRTDDDTLGALNLAVILTRAPILVPINALQSMLIARLSGATAGRNRLFALVLAVIATLTVLVAGVVWLWGGPLLAAFFGEDFLLSASTLAGLVAAAGCLGVLTATGAAALALERHSFFAAGWIVAAAFALAILAFLPASLETRIVLGLVVGPLLGAVVHLAALRTRNPEQQRGE